MKRRVLKMLGRRVTVEFHPGRVFDDSDERVFGYYDKYANAIKICGGISADQLRATLLHEILHAALELSGCGQAVKEPGGDAEETFCRGVEAGLYDALRSNPWLVQMLLED